MQEQFKKFETGRWLSEIELEKKFKKFLKTPVLQDPKQKVGSSDGRLVYGYILVCLAVRNQIKPLERGQTERDHLEEE